MTITAPTRDAAGRWQPGESGNPNGRPRKGMALAEALRGRLGREVTLADGTKVTVAEAVAGRLVALALAGDVAALRLLFDRAEGRMPLAIDLMDEDVPRVIRLPLPAPPDGPGDEPGGEPGEEAADDVAP